MAMMTLYDVLGVSPDADPETIKQAFRRAVKAHHPDLQGGDSAASRRVKAIITANAILRDPERRAAYDRHLAVRRQRSRSKRRRDIIQFAFSVVVMSTIMIGAAELWLASTTVPAGKVAESVQPRDDAATLVLPGPEQDPPQARDIGNDAPPAAAQGTSSEASSSNVSSSEVLSSEVLPASPPIAPENRGGAAEAAAAIDSATSEQSTAAAPFPATAASYRERASDWIRKGDLDRAIADLGRAIDLAPEDAAAYRQRGNAFGLKGDVDRALADYDHALEIDPNDASVFHDRGLMWQRSKEFDKALADLDHAVRMGFTAPQIRNSQVYLDQIYSDRGAVWFEKGSYDRALADLNQAIKVNPGLATAYARRAGVFERKGDQERARADRDQAAFLDHGLPGNFQSDVAPHSVGAH
jgi:curved DNA-binding protein CbpA